MELSQDITKGLELLGDPKQIPDNCFAEITQLAFGIILERVSEDHISSKCINNKLLAWFEDEIDILKRKPGSIKTRSNHNQTSIICVNFIYFRRS